MERIPPASVAEEVIEHDDIGDAESDGVPANHPLSPKATEPERRATLDSILAYTDAGHQQPAVTRVLSQAPRQSRAPSQAGFGASFSVVFMHPQLLTYISSPAGSRRTEP